MKASEHNVWLFSFQHSLNTVTQLLANFPKSILTCSINLTNLLWPFSFLNRLLHVYFCRKKNHQTQAIE